MSRRGGAPAQLTDAASACYRAAGPFAWRFARAKLALDPVFSAILAHGLLAGRARILDLGCGQGLLAAWLLAAHACHAGAAPGVWPAGWPAPPKVESYRGVEINPREVARARRAFALDPGARVQIVHGDIRDVDYAAADAVVLLDVLHYLDYPAQEKVLQRVRRALVPQGVLLLRIGDAAGGAGFLLSQAVDGTVALLRRRRWVRLHCRALAAWQALLGRCGFRAQALPMSAGTPFVNVLLRAELA
ncbi:MAG TPA: class I SAM-dependent methyltransferase [Steroidobacteraceae bacterium]|nr:class I SAM-dependent methyltransferase [Steroidobacteraceae bacterium]